MDDQKAGAPEFKELRARGEAHPIEKTGRELRRVRELVRSGTLALARGPRSMTDRALAR